MVIIGVIRPPPEIRAVADRTASYVAKNGRAFESRILNSAKGKTPKFAFLQPTSPFHAYYEDRIQFYENGGEDETEEQKDEEKKKAAEEASAKKRKDGKQLKHHPHKESSSVRKKDKMQKASAIDPIAKALLTQRSKISQVKAKQKQKQKEALEAKGDEEGSQHQHQHQHQHQRHRATVVITPPPPLELVTIVAPGNLSTAQIETIQLVAQFAAMDGKGGVFLHQLTLREWSNPVFSFCQPRHSHFAYFSALVDAYRRIIGTWTTAATSKSDVPATEMADVQMALEEAAYRAEYIREIEQQRSQQQEEGEVVAIDWHDFVVVETIEFPVDEKVELSMLPPPPPPLPSATTPTQSAAAADANANANQDLMVESDDEEEEEETIRVVPSYTPKVVGTANPQAARAIDPITGKSVSVADMPEHMRIQLLDPKWAEERKKFQDKQKDSNLVGGDAIVNNLSRYSQAKGDLFGKSEQELLDKEKDSKRRLEEANRIIRDQANQQAPGFAPHSSTSGPRYTGPPSAEPLAKRMRMEAPSTSLPPPPVGMTTVVAPPPPPPPLPPTSSIGMQPSGNPMADSMLPTNTVDGDVSEEKLLSEAEFVASLSKPEVTLQIRIPNDPSQMAWNFYGQILSLTVNVMSKVKQVKTDLSRLHLNNMPANKIQFKDPNAGFLKDSMTLAALNVGPTATVDLVPKTRGGRR